MIGDGARLLREPSVAHTAAKLLTCFVMATLAACAGRARIAPGPNISSERSDYSPSLRLAVSVKPLLSQPDSIVVSIDSGVITAAGVQSPELPAEMRNLYISALVTRRTVSAARDARTQPWSALAESDSILIADSLRLGETRTLQKIRFALARPKALDPSAANLVFRITGIAIDEHANGRVTRPLMRGARIRVYACSDWTLDGFVDERQQKALAQAYNSAC